MMTELQKLRLAGLNTLIGWLNQNDKPLSWIARELGIKRQAVSQWRSVPDEHMEDVSRLTGIPLRELRPDLALLAHRLLKEERSAA
jgi:hypothetical protein